MIDIHSHIIPGIDDGADSIETALLMLKMAKEDGIKKIFATPHYYKGYYETPYNEVVQLVNELNVKAKENTIDIEVLPGQEVHLTRDILKLYKDGIVNTLGNTKYMLIELPFENLPKYCLDLIYELKILGIKPIIAHPERYEYIIKKPSTINQFIDEGCLFQINTSSFEGLFGKEIKKTAEILINHNLCHFIASDCHTTKNRCPGLKKSFDTLNRYDKEHGKMLLKNVESALNGQELNQPIEKIKVNTRFWNNIFKKR